MGPEPVDSSTTGPTTHPDRVIFPHPRGVVTLTTLRGRIREPKPRSGPSPAPVRPNLVPTDQAKPPTQRICRPCPRDDISGGT